MSRGIIKNSDLSFFPSLVKEKKFNDTVKGLTIFVESKKNNNLKNIFLRDDSDNSESSTIIAKSGYVIKKGGYDFLILFDGIVQKEKVKNNEVKESKISTINFTKTEINLSRYAAHTITHPKIQERSSLALFACLVKFTNSIFPNFNLNDWASENCYYWTDEADMKRNANEYLNELNRRFILPFYIPLIALISCFLLSSKRENKNSLLRLSCFVTGILIIIFAEISLRSANNSKTLLYVFYTFPLAFGILNYLILLKIFAFESLKK
jgi:lipopolysaccharide export system permease protein